ncbi:MAG: helix-turn-helix domain-containing protein [Acholeplasmatales bacterium]|nr:helix-turn-helix domain-containing protein [Acholeplasmatales bacterium]
MNRLKELRLERNLTLRELAEKVKISYSALSLAENGKRNLTDSDIIIFCNFFGVSADYLLCLSNIRTIMSQPQNNIQLNQYQLALYNASKQLNDAEKEQVIDFVNYIKNKKSST